MSIADKLNDAVAGTTEAEMASTAPARESGAASRWVQVLIPVAMLVLLLVVWQAYVTIANVPHYILPSPLRIWQAFIEDHDMLLHSLVITLKTTFLALAIALVTGVALAVSNIVKEKNGVFIDAGAGTSDLTNAQCTPNTIHWSYDTYTLAHGTGTALTKAGGDSWFFLTADYAFGAALERDTTAAVQAAGGKVLGGVIDQKGSLVDSDKTRFDFSHDEPLTPDQITEVERLVNEKIYADVTVIAKEMALAEAKQIPGVRAVFGEKYPDPVRVVLIGAHPLEGVTGDPSGSGPGGGRSPQNST